MSGIRNDYTMAAHSPLILSSRSLALLLLKQAAAMPVLLLE